MFHWLDEKGKAMNYSTAVFLINHNIRAVVGTYEAGDNAPRTTFKTLDPSLKEGDFVVVPTTTRHNMTVVKIVAVDVDVDFDNSSAMQWVICKINQAPYNDVLAQEASAINAIKSAETRRKRDELRDALLKDQAEIIKALPIASAGNNDALPASE